MEKSFKKTVWKYYKEHGRHDLPWRKVGVGAYKIMVSEVMLQQTQVDRVIPKYIAFIKQFGTIQKLAQAEPREVLALWSGLGYNRRALYLHNTAKIITEKYKDKVPSDPDLLEQLPGIGPYTARAIVTFAYNIPHAFIETNIRTVYIHHFFAKKKSVADAELMQIIEKTLDIAKPREWYWALMDYGSMLKRSQVKVHTKSTTYTKQSKFKGSNRQMRGEIMRHMNTVGSATLTSLTKKFSADARFQLALESLIKDKLISKKGNKVYI